MSKHTPGPWTLLGSDATMHREVENSDGVLIMAETEYGSETPTNHADWMLIAAAPELLAALVQMVANSAADGKEYRDCHKAAVDAIAKAQVAQ